MKTMDIDILNIYMNQVKKQNLLSMEETDKLIELHLKGDVNAREKLILSNLFIVIFIAICSKEKNKKLELFRRFSPLRNSLL